MLAYFMAFLVYLDKAFRKKGNAPEPPARKPECEFRRYVWMPEFWRFRRLKLARPAPPRLKRGRELFE